MVQKVGAIIVTHNSKGVIRKCLDFIQAQTHPVEELIIVDSGSYDTGYLDSLQTTVSTHVIKTSNIGFAKGNNLGVERLDQQLDIILFLNPDTFLAPTFIKQVVEKFQNNENISVLSGKLLGFDIHTNNPNGRIDSAGIYRKWYGRWYDRGHGELDDGRYNKQMLVPALCGALLCIRTRVLHQLDGPLFDADFFMYKEDIELSIRIRKKGIGLLYCPELIAYHCRGWNRSRKDIDQKLKKHASKNEIILYTKHPSPYMIWALLKYFVVSVLRI